MRRISSGGSTVWVKVTTALPLIVFAVILVANGIALVAGKGEPTGLIVPAAALLVGFFLGRQFVWNLADEVVDCGDSLRVRRGRQEETIALADIVDVSLGAFSRPSRVIVTLAVPGAFGDRIAFIPNDASLFLPFFRSAVARELRERARAARPFG